MKSNSNDDDDDGYLNDLYSQYVLTNSGSSADAHTECHAHKYVATSLGPRPSRPICSKQVSARYGMSDN